MTADPQCILSRGGAAAPRAAVDALVPKSLHPRRSSPRMQPHVTYPRPFVTGNASARATPPPGPHAPGRLRALGLHLQRAGVLLLGMRAVGPHERIARLLGLGLLVGEVRLRHGNHELDAVELVHL